MRGLSLLLPLLQIYDMAFAVDLFVLHTRSARVTLQGEDNTFSFRVEPLTETNLKITNVDITELPAALIIDVANLHLGSTRSRELVTQHFRRIEMIATADGSRLRLEMAPGWTPTLPKSSGETSDELTLTFLASNASHPLHRDPLKDSSIAAAYLDDLEDRKKDIESLMGGNFNEDLDTSTKKAMKDYSENSRAVVRHARQENQRTLIIASVVLGSLILFLVYHFTTRNLAKRKVVTLNSAHPRQHFLHQQSNSNQSALNNHNPAKLREEKKRIKEALKTLGIPQDNGEVSPEEIKRKYKQLVKVFHEDRLSAQDLPEEMIELAGERFRRIQEAYEALKRDMDFQ